MKLHHLRKQIPTLRGRIVTLCIGTIVGFLILCVSFLFLLIFNVLSGYVENDLDFALKETNSNLVIKTDILEDIL